MKGNKMNVEFAKVVNNGITPYLTEREAERMYTDAMLRSKKSSYTREEANVCVMAGLAALEQIGRNDNLPAPRI